MSVITTGNGFGYLTFGIGHYGWLVLNQTLAADFFGSRNFATIRGLINTFQIPVSIVIPLCMGLVYDSNRNYQIAYVAIAGLVVAGALSLNLVRRPLWIQEPAAKPGV